jgi:hypothetical protein
VRVDEREAPAAAEILLNQRLEESSLARSGLTDYVEVVATIGQANAKETLLIAECCAAEKREVAHADIVLAKSETVEAGVLCYEEQETFSRACLLGASWLARRALGMIRVRLSILESW